MQEPLILFTIKESKEIHYNIGGFNEWTNISLVKLLCKVMDEKLDNKAGASEELITFVKDDLVMISDIH